MKGGKADADRHKAVTLRGQPVSPGVAIGRAWLCDRATLADVPSFKIDASRVDDELARFRRALDRSRVELQELQELVRSRAGEKDADIFRAHIAMLNDPYLIAQVETESRATLMNLESVLAQVIRRFQEIFLSIDDGLIRARSADVVDVGARILRNLVPEEAAQRQPSGGEAVVLVAEELVPSITVRRSGRIAAMVTERGDLSSHAAILARSFNIPAVIGCAGVLDRTRDGDLVVVDAREGRVVLRPSEGTAKRFRTEQSRHLAERAALEAERNLPAVMRDGGTVSLMANIGLPEEAELVLKAGLPGVGLFRTEFCFMHRADFPREEEQVHLYRHVGETLAGREVTVRLLDIASDKRLDYFKLGGGAGSMLGFRGLRILLAHPQILRIQLRALLRAATSGNFRLLVPMVTTHDEALEFRARFDEARAELAAEGVPFARDLPVGLMIEVPALVHHLPELAPAFDFFSVGTNDLIQYALACDRNVREVAYLYNPFDRAILRLLAQIRKAVPKGRRLSICGEIAGDPYFTNPLLALGYREFSMGLQSAPLVKRAVRATDAASAAAVLARVLDAPSRAAAATVAREAAQALLSAAAAEIPPAAGARADRRPRDTDRA